MIRRLLNRVCDRRRWHAARVAFTHSALLLVAVDETTAGPCRNTIVAIASDDDAWQDMAAAAEQLPDAVRDGWFRGIDRWLEGHVSPAPEPEPGTLERLDPRRFAAMRDAFGADGFLSIAVWEDGAHAATTLLGTDEYRSDVADACEQLVDAVRHGAIDDRGGRITWMPDDAGGDAA